MGKREVQAQLFKFGIEMDSEELTEVFEAIDIHETGELVLEDFISGLSRMRGPASAKGILRVHMTVERLAQRIPHAAGLPPTGPRGSSISRRIDLLEGAIEELIGKVSDMENQMTELMTYMGRRRAAPGSRMRLLKPFLGLGVQPGGF